MKIKFKHHNGHTSPLLGESNEERFLFYLYKVSVSEKTYYSGNGTYLDFDSAKISRDKVVIDTFENIKKNEF